MALLTIVLNTGSGDSSAALADRTVRLMGPSAAIDPARSANLLASFLRGLAAGNYAGDIVALVNTTSGTAASGTVQCVFANASAGQTVTIAGEVFTCVANTAVVGENQFAIGTTNATLAANLLAAIQASKLAAGLLTASLSTATITLTSRIPGLFGNGITLATSAGTAFVVSASTLASGTANSGNVAASEFKVG